MNPIWRPFVTDNVWYPRLSPDGKRIMFGARQVWVATFPGSEVCIGPSAANERWYPLGWKSATVLYYAKGVFDGEMIVPPLTIWSLDVVTAETHQIDAVPDAQGLMARNGHYSTSIAGQALWLDGVRLPEYFGWRVDLDGRDVITAWYGAGHPGTEVYAGPQMYCDGVHIGGHPRITEENGGNVRDGHFTSIHEGRCVTWTPGDVTLKDITLLPPGACGFDVPLYCHGWWCQTLEHVQPGDRTMMQIWPDGETAVYAAERPKGRQGTFDVVWDDERQMFVVATQHDDGQLVVEWVPLDVPRKPWSPSPPPESFLRDLRSPNPVGPRYAVPTDPDPVVAPIGTMWMGALYVMSFKYGPNDDWAKHHENGQGAHLRYPGNCCVIAGEAAAGLTAPFEHVIMTPDAILGGMADGPESWARMAGFYLAAEASSNGVEIMRRARDAARANCATMGVVPVPFYTYTPGRAVTALPLVEADGRTVIGLECYANPGETAADLYTLAHAYRQQIPRGTPVCIWGMSYDRNDAYTGDLRPIILAAADIARSWNADDPSSVRALLYFSDGRGSVAGGFGGARWHPEVYPVLRAIAAACERP